MTAPNETLRTILPIAGWADGQAADVVFTGGADPVLPTPFRIGAAGAATLAAAGGAGDRCDAQFFIGEWQLLQADRPAAIESLKAAADTCPKTFAEFRGAQAELKRLGE